jgi:hypothetical protein
MRCRCGWQNPEGLKRCQQCRRRLANWRALRRRVLDVAAAAGLVAALGLVWALDPGSAAPSAGAISTDVIPEGELGAEGNAAHVISRALRLAVTPPEYDDMGRLLATLGSGYRYEEIPMESLLDADRLARFDVVFATCGGVPDSWLSQQVGGAERGARGTYRADAEKSRQLHAALRSFVGRGGTLYVSDWQLQLLEIAFPELIDPAKRARGAVQTVRAEVVDQGLARRLGPAIELRFDKRAWYPAAFRSGEVTTYLRGGFTTLDGQATSGELLVKFPYENGNVVFTSFHNEAQNSATETELLRYLVFATVTAREEAHVRRTMVRGGFSPQERNLLSASSGGQPLSQEYQCRRPGPLRFVLSFEEQGAELRLAVAGPDGTRREQTGTKTFQIEVADARPGMWRYAITPLSVPYQHFPFVLTIGEKQ